MESAQEHEPTAYDMLCDKLKKLAESENRNMSTTEIHKSARNLMGYVELVIKINRRNEKANQNEQSRP